MSREEGALVEKITTLGVPLTPDRALLSELTDSVLRSGRYSNSGTLNAQLEAHLAALLHVPEAMTASSGTAALTLALLALDLPPGAEVITTPLTFPATTQAIEAAGLRPVFAAVDPQTLTLDPSALASAITPRTGAVLAVHLFGVLCDPEIDRLPGGIPVVYDAAHAFDIGDTGRQVAARGTLSAFSLHATKLLHTGEGGLVVTGDAGCAERVRRRRNFGLVDDVAVDQGLNAKLSEFAAAVGLAVLPGVPREVEIRERHRAQYRALIAASDRVGEHASGHDAALLFQPVRCAPDDQGALLSDLASVGIVGRRFPALTDPRSRFRDVPLVGTTAAALETLASSVIALPLHSSLPSDYFERIAEIFGGR